jgi:PAS domain S-box-containing protein
MMNKQTDETENFKRTIERLTKELQDYRLLFQRAPLGYQSLDEQGRFIDVNEAWQRILGYSREELIGKWFGDFLDGSSAELFKTKFSGFKEKGEAHGVELNMRCKDGRIISATFDGRVGFDDDGKFKQTHCILADVTEKRRTEALKQAEFENLQAVFDAIPYGLIIAGQDENILMINRTGLSLMGYSDPAELINTPCRTRICHNDPENCQEGINGKSVEHSECMLRHKSGKQIPIRKTAVPIQFEDESVILETFQEISDQKRRMEDLIESRRQFATLLDNLPGMVYRCLNDPDWTMEFISDGCLELTGYNPVDLVGNKLLSYNDMIVKEDRERVWNEVQLGISTNKPYTLEYRIKCREGRIKWVWEKGKCILNGAGEVTCIEGFVSDISEKKHAELIQEVLFEISKASYTTHTIEEILRLIHKNLGLIIDVGNFYVAMYDEQTNTISLPFQVDSQDHFAAFPAGKTATSYVIRTKQPLLATREVIEKLSRAGEIEIVGTLAKVWLGVPLILADKVIGVIAVQSYTDPDQYTVRDLELLKFIADQIATAISKKGAEESFQKEKAYLDQLFEGSHEAIVMTDEKGMVVKVNSEFLKLFGFTESEILDHNIDDLIADPGNRNESLKITADVLNGNAAEIESRRSHRDGHLIDVSILGTPVIINGVVVAEYGIYRDITDRKRIEKNMIAAKEKAEESDKLKSAFLSNMSHEIRTPMNAILGFSSLLSDPALSDDERTEFIQIIKERGNDLMRIIDDIIDVAKIESGQIKIEIKECKVNLLMSNLTVTLNEVKRKTNKTKVVLNCLPGSNDPEFSILTDSNRLRQIMTNLIENGLKFTDQGYVEFGYKFKNIGSSPYIEFFVRDSGIGISREMHDVIFERFRQVDDTATRRYGGTGLGLTISKNLAQLLGGQITMESERGKGTSFYILFPLHLNQARLAETVVPKPVATSVNKWASKVILVVEDEDSNFLLMERMLKSTGVQLIWVKNGIDAIELCNSQMFDLVLMDIRMPMMDGYETTQIIKKDHKNLPVIAQTAYALKGEREKSLAAGCDNYISKPIDTRELLAVLGKYLNDQK